MEEIMRLSQKALDYRNSLNTQVVRYSQGDAVALNGCLPADDFDREVKDELMASSVSISSWSAGEMPVFKFDSEFERYMADRRKACENLIAAGLSWLPWDVLKALPAERKQGGDYLYFSQGAVPDCMGHADAFAHNSVTLIDIALGQPLIYRPINPIVTWYLSKNKSMRGGQTVSVMSKWANELGHFAIADVGRENTTVPRNYESFTEKAKEQQSGVCFLEGRSLVDAAALVLQSGLAIALGNSTAVRGATVDKNGMRVAVLNGSWAHATHLVGYRKVNGTDYYGWINSHGARYGTAKDGMPADGCWMTRDILARFLSTCPSYGAPYAVVPESPVLAHNSLERIVAAVLPLV
jgi:hypothetical protein